MLRRGPWSARAALQPRRTRKLLEPSEAPQPHDAQPPASTLGFGPLSIDLDGFAVFVAGRHVRLTYSEFVLLRELALRPYRVVDRDALQEAMHRGRTGDAAEPIDPRSIDRHIVRLRRKLREAGCDCIETMRYTGYRLVPPEAPLHDTQ